MKTNKHVLDKQSYDASIDVLFKLDPVQHRKVIVDGCVLAAANVANLALHILNKVREQTDIKHNKIEGFILRSKPFGDASIEISRMYRNLEDVKYRVVHGSSTSKDDVKKAVVLYKQLTDVLLKIDPKIKLILNKGDRNE